MMSFIQRVFLIVFVGMWGHCSPAVQPARPRQFEQLHARITEVELRMVRDDETRKNRFKETVQQTKEINAIAVERFTFSTAVARIWAEVHQELDALVNTLDLAVQGVDYIEKSLAFHQAKLAKAWRDFQLNYGDHARELRKTLCEQKPDSPRCENVFPTQEPMP